MDTKDYIDRLKTTDLRPDKIKLKETKEVILMEDNTPIKILHEIFVKVAEIESMPIGNERDIQMLRLAIIAEMDASNLYEKLALLAKDKNIKKLMLSISREEKVHVGEFETLLEKIDTEYENAEEEGEKEVNDLTNI